MHNLTGIRSGYFFYFRLMNEHAVLSVVFFGTPEFASSQLDAVVRAGFQVKAVVTATDKPSGRGRLLSSSAVKQFALQSGIPVLQPFSLRDEEFLSTLKKIGADVFVVVAFRMLPEAVWRIPPKGTFNLHASLLPDYRGAAPINHAIINGETTTGLTTFFIDAQIDAGAIIQQKELKIGPSETAGELHSRMMAEGRLLVVQTLQLIADGRAIALPQPPSGTGKEYRNAPKIFRDDCRINWQQPAKNIFNHIRGLSPYPGAFTNLHSSAAAVTELKIFKASLTHESYETPIGTLVFPQKNRVLVSLEKTSLELLEIQASGKKPMNAPDFFRGLQKDAGWFVA